LWRANVWKLLKSFGLLEVEDLNAIIAQSSQKKPLSRYISSHMIESSLDAGKRNTAVTMQQLIGLGRGGKCDQAQRQHEERFHKLWSFSAKKGKQWTTKTAIFLFTTLV